MLPKKKPKMPKIKGTVGADAATATAASSHVPAGQSVCAELSEECYGEGGGQTID